MNLLNDVIRLVGLFGCLVVFVCLIVFGYPISKELISYTKDGVWSNFFWAFSFGIIAITLFFAFILTVDYEQKRGNKARRRNYHFILNGYRALTSVTVIATNFVLCIAFALATLMFALNFLVQFLLGV